jgi:hypothetical protein
VSAGRWLAIAIAVAMGLCIVGLIVYARGPKHHHGNEIGTHGTKIVLTQTTG